MQHKVEVLYLRNNFGQEGMTMTLLTVAYVFVRIWYIEEGILIKVNWRRIYTEG